MRRFLFALTILACAAVPAAGAPPHRAVAATPRPADRAERLQHAMVLAKVTQPEELVIQSALRDMDRNMVTVMQANDQFKEIEATFPGFSKRYYAAARPELEKTFRARLPRMWDAVADVFASQMTVQEIDSATKFFSSPLGDRIIHLQIQNLDTKPLLAIGLKDGLSDQGPSAEAATTLRSAATGASLSTVADLTPAERSAMLDFSVSPAGRAVRRAGPQILKAILAWSATDDPDADKRMGEIAIEVVQQMKQERGGAQ